jgi:hypothetical protein
MVLKKSSATKKSVTTPPVKKTSGLRWIAVLSMPIIGLLRFLVSVVFFLIWLVAADPSSPMAWDSLLAAVQSFSNRWLGILWLLSIPLTIVWIIVLVKNGQGLISESIATWRAGAKKYIGKWIGFIVGYLAITVVLSIVLWDGPVYTVFTQILSIFFSICVYTAAIHVIYNNTLMWKSYFDVSFMKIVKYIFAWIMYWASIMLWLILLVIPGIIVMVRCSFFNVAVLKDGLSPSAALKRSRQITKGNFWNVLWLMIIQWLIQIPGMLALLVGLFWTVPTVWMSDVKAYQTLSEAKKQ